MTGSEDAAALDARLGAARSVRVYDAGCLHYPPPQGERILRDAPVLVEDAPESLTELRAALAVVGVPSWLCMCPGSVTFEFLDDDGARVAVVGLHHGQYLRWAAWSADAELEDGLTLSTWLAAHGVPGPLEELREAAALRERHQAEDEAWARSVPDCLRDLIDEMLSSDGGPVPDHVAERLAEAHPDVTERCRVLLAWYAGGTGRYTDFPVYEEIPGRLVEAMPLDAVLAALTGEPPDGEVWVGALRHLSGWKTRTPREVRRVPADVWAGLLDLARRRDDQDSRRRMERMGAKYRRGA